MKRGRRPNTTGDLADLLAWQLRCAQAPHPKGVREYRFHARRRWRFDLAWPDRRLAVECNGGEFKQGRHGQGLGMAADYEKLNTAALDGWTVLQFTGAQVRTGYALAVLETALAAADDRARRLVDALMAGDSCLKATDRGEAEAIIRALHFHGIRPS